MRKHRIYALLTVLIMLLTALPLSALAAEDVTGTWALDEVQIGEDWYSLSLLKLLGIEIEMTITFNSDGKGVVVSDEDSMEFDWYQFDTTILVGGAFASLTDGKLVMTGDEFSYRFVRTTAAPAGDAGAASPTRTDTADAAASDLNKPVVTASGVSITPVGVRISKGDSWLTPDDGKVYVLVEIAVKNGSDSSVSFSSTLSFSIIEKGESKYGSFAALLVSDTPLDATVAPGAEAKGEVGFEVDEGWESLEIHYKPMLLSSEDYTFTVLRSDVVE